MVIDSPHRLKSPWRATAARLASAAVACVAGGVGATTVSCGDPVPDAAVAALGPENSAVPPGPLHRPGQPCLVCHVAGGRAPAFSLGGTVFVDVTGKAPVGNVDVIILDAANRTYTSQTNCAGNFYVLPSEFAPTYPYWATLRAGTVQRDMDSPSYRDGSCAACHAGAPGPASAGVVYLIDDPTTETIPPNQCH
jgi:hypothetical protein